MLDRLTASLDFHGKALQLRSQRQAVLANNIANADTPGFVARDFDFASELQARTRGGATGSAPNGSAPGTTIPTPMLGLSGSSPGHLNGTGQAAGSATNVQLKYRTPEQASLDRNTVDLDRERANFADNAVRYESTLRFINGNVRSMISAIRGE
jgi:flagellar basal-body rod protein FlgB